MSAHVGPIRVSAVQDLLDLVQINESVQDGETYGIRYGLAGRSPYLPETLKEIQAPSSRGPGERSNAFTTTFSNRDKAMAAVAPTSPAPMILIF
jgi:hypothetical protein